MFKRLLGNKSTFLRFFISYILILILPTFVGFLISTFSIRNIKGQVEEYNMVMIQQAQRLVDERLDKVEKLALDISFNKQILDFLLVSKSVDTLDYTELQNTSDIINYLGKSKMINRYMKEIYIYFMKSDILLNSSKKYTPEQYYQISVENKVGDFESYRERINKRYYNVFNSFELNGATGGSGNQLILYMHSIPLYSWNSMGTIVMQLDPKIFLEILEDINLTDSGGAYIMDSGGKIILDAGNEAMAPDWSDEAFTDDKGFAYSYAQGKEIITFYARSEVKDWIYFLTVPTRDMLQNVNKMQQFMFMLLGLELILGLVTCIFLARKNLAPIIRLVKNIQENVRGGDAQLNSKNEMDFIEKSMLSIINESKEARTAIEKQAPAIRNNLFLKLFKGNYDTTDDLAPLFKSVGIDFAHPWFAVLVIQIADCYNEALKADWQLVKFAVTNVIQELGGEFGEVYPVDEEWEQITVLLNLTDSNEAIYNGILNMSRRTSQVLLERLNIKMIIGIGSIYSGMNQVEKSYSEAKVALEYRLVRDDELVLEYRALPSSTQKIIYPIEKEMQLLNAIKSGDLEKSRQLLNQIFRLNFEEQAISLELARCLFFDMMSTVVKVLSSLSEDPAGLLGERGASYEQFLKSTSVMDMRQNMERILEEVCSHISRERKTGSTVLLERLREYLEANYTDPDISLNKVADAFDMNSSYLSFLFKEHTNENFLEYIRRRRIEKAEELLAGTSLSLNEISESLGYINTGVFIRNFKKVRQTTPGQFRAAAREKTVG